MEIGIHESRDAILWSHDLITKPRDTHKPLTRREFSCLRYHKFLQRLSLFLDIHNVDKPIYRWVKCSSYPFKKHRSLPYSLNPSDKICSNLNLKCYPRPVRSYTRANLSRVDERFGSHTVDRAANSFTNPLLGNTRSNSLRTPLT